MVEGTKTQVEVFAINHNHHTSIMKELFEAVLTDPSARTADAAEAIAVSQAEFLSWT